MSSRPALMPEDGSRSTTAGSLGNGAGANGDQSQGNSKGGFPGEVEHIHYLSAHIGALYLSEEYSDVTLVVEGQPFSAHRVILASRSDYFRALLFGGMKESRSSEVELKNTPLVAFRHLLRYIYTGQMTLANQKDDLILDVLGLAHQYGFVDLETSISDYLRAILSVRNVCLIYDMASMYALQALLQSCHSYMDRHATEVILHASFLSLSPQGIKDIISRDSFCAPEVDIFKAVHNWVQSNTEESEMAEQILSSVRLSLMSTQDLLKVVRPTGLVPPDIMLDAIQSRTESRNMELNYRGCLIYEENVATPKHGAVVIQGDYRQALLDGDTKNYDMEKGFTRHTIDDSNIDAGGIVIQLGTQCIINHIRLLLWDREPRRTYSYVVDLSMDQNDWFRVVDYSKYHCRSWQDLYFTPRVVKYIRIIGTYNSVNKIFHCVSLEAFYTKREFQLDGHNFIVPRQNVATLPMSAYVREGVCRSKNALLNGDTSDYNWDYGYTCHQLGSGAIVVQLGQPYALDSIRLLLWDCDDRSYSYYIEVSRNEKDWDLICDRSEVPCRSWQTITFPRRPVVYIKIVGTRNTANEVFHCVHFECPAAAIAGSVGGGAAAAVAGGAAAGDGQGSNISSASSSVVTDEDNVAAAAAVAGAVGGGGGAAPNPQPVNDSGNPAVAAAAAAAVADIPVAQAAVAAAVPQPVARHQASKSIPVLQHAQPVVGVVGANLGGGHDDAASTASNLANFQDDGPEEDPDRDEDDSGSGVAEGEGGLADQMSHHSSPTSYAGSVAGSAAGISANNSLPVGASACSIARAEQDFLTCSGGGGGAGGVSGIGGGGGGGGKKSKKQAVSVQSGSVVGGAGGVGVGGARGGSPMTSSSSNSSSPPSPSPTNEAAAAAATAPPIHHQSSKQAKQRFHVNVAGSFDNHLTYPAAAASSPGGPGGHHHHHHNPHHPSVAPGGHSPFGSAQSLPPLVSSSSAGAAAAAAAAASGASEPHVPPIGSLPSSGGAAASTVAEASPASLNLRSLRTSHSSASAAAAAAASANWTAATPASTSSSPARSSSHRTPSSSSFDIAAAAAAASTASASRHHRQPPHQGRSSHLSAEMFGSNGSAAGGGGGGAVPRRNVRKSEEP